MVIRLFLCTFACIFHTIDKNMINLSTSSDISWNTSNVFGSMVCDTPVPYYDMGISCGLPNEMGDIPPEMMMVPGMLTMGLSVTMVRARGDSMVGVGIHDGDLLMLESTCRINSGDIVAAVIDGEEMLKTYYMDECGQHWLVPANDQYDALLLTEDMDVRFAGRLLWHIRKEVHDSTRNIRQAIERQKNKNAQTTATVKELLSREKVVETMRTIAPKIKVGRHWLGPCRVLMDHGFIPKDRFDLFCILAKEVLPHHEHKPQTAELQRMAVGCFSKPFDKWTDATAPVHGKHYLGYYDAADAMRKALL